MESSVPAEVIVPGHLMPDLRQFVFGALTNAMSMSVYWNGNDDMVASEISSVVSVSCFDGHIWIWDCNGAGDFVRISSAIYGRRWMVAFDHESDRSPWGADDEQLMGDLTEWLSDQQLAELRNSDRLLSPSGPPSITEVYRLRPLALNGEERVRDIAELDGLDDEERKGKLVEQTRRRQRWHTNPTIANLVLDHSRTGWTGASDEEAPFAAMMDALIAGKRPSLAELIELTGAELPAAAALLAIHRIDQWLDSDNEACWT
jgi:hypothetical protein